MAADRDSMHGRGAEGVLERRLRGLWAQHVARLVARGACRVVTAFVALVLLDLLLDWPLDLAGAARLGLLAANLAVLGALAQRGLLRHLRPYDAVDQALHVERTAPELDGLVVSSVQFADEAAYAPTLSRELMRAVRRQAAERAGPQVLAKASGGVALRKAFAAALVAVAVLAAVGVWKGRYLWVLACRMVNPASTLAYPTDTTIEVLSGEPVVRHGEPVTLSARAGGVVPAAGQLRVRVAGLGWETLPVARQADDLFGHAIPRATDDLEYYFRLGDARSARHRVTVVRPPRVVEARVGLEYPPYTRLADQQVDSLNLKVPEGTHLTWRLRFDKPILAAEMKLEGAGARAMAVSADGSAAGLRLPAEASRPYTIAFRWRLGGREYLEAGPKHYLQVIPDADPLVAMLRPAADVKATLRKTVGLSYWARDDYGLGEAWIVYSINDGAEQRRPLGSLGGRTNAEKQLVWPITQAVSGLRHGDIVTFAVEVTDGRPGSPGRNRSISRRVQFVTDAEYVAHVLARQRKFLGQLRPLYLQEREAARQLEAVARPAAGPAPPTSRPSKEVRP